MDDELGKRPCVCAIPPCGRRIRPDKLMCFSHWELVPEQLRVTVYRTWNAFVKAPPIRCIGLERWGAIRKAYIDARKAAIEAVVQQQASA